MKVYAPARENVPSIFNALFDPVARGCCSPKMVFHKTENGFVFEAEVPGYEPEKIDVSFDSAVFTVKGEKVDFEEKPVSFERRFELPFIPSADAVKADLRNGLLRVTIPQPESSAQKRIEINVA